MRAHALIKSLPTTVTVPRAGVVTIVQLKSIRVQLVKTTVTTT